MAIRRRHKILFPVVLFFGVASSSFAEQTTDAQSLFKKKCALCHAIDKKKLGPSIQSMSKEKEVLLQIITKGKNAMPGYEGKLTGTEIAVLADYLLKNQ